jgi:predicted transposase/invertase (TIGR01784 family)
MKEFTKEIQEVMEDANFGESYDKEWALRDLGHSEGRKEGIEEGRKAGKEEGIKTIAQNLLKDGFDVKTIAKNTNLSEEEIEELKASI